MRKIPAVMFLAAFLHFGAAAGLSQKNTLTNNDVAEMIRAGLDETTIILAIQKSDPQFDTSAKALIELHQIGAGPKILETLLRPKPAVSGSPNTDQNAPRVSAREVVLIDGENRTILTRSKAYLTYSTPLFGPNKSFITIDGTRSELRVSDPTPVFEASFPSDVIADGKFMLVKLTLRSGRRTVETSKKLMPGSLIGFREEEIVPTIFEEIRTYLTSGGARYKLYRVRTAEPLPPGEYAFTPQNYFLEYYDFAVEEKPK